MEDHHDRPVASYSSAREHSMKTATRILPTGRALPIGVAAQMEGSGDGGAGGKVESRGVGYWDNYFLA